MKPLLQSLKPKYWVSAHLHVKFIAKVNHSARKPVPIEEILQLEKCFYDLIAKPETLKKSQHTAKCVQENDETVFLALDKCLPRRSFLQVHTIQFFSFIHRIF